MRIRWDADEGEEPLLGDVVAEISATGGDPAELERLFRVVGIEEPSRGRTWGIVFERLEWPGFTPALHWCFSRDRR